MRRSITPYLLLAALCALLAATAAVAGLPVPQHALLALALEAPPAEPGEPAAGPKARPSLAEAEKLRAERKHAEALAAADQALTAAMEAKDAPGQALAHRLRARCLQSLGKPEEAVTAWRAAREAWRVAGEGPGQIEALGVEALLLLAMQPEAAQRRLDEAATLTDTERTRPLAGVQTLAAVAQVLYQRGSLSQARRLLEVARVAGIRVRAESPEVASLLHRLGTVARAQRDLPGAKEYHLRALAIREKIVDAEGIPSLEVAASLDNLGALAEERRELKEAEEYYLRALAIRERRAPESPATAATLTNLGAVLWRQGVLPQARGYYLRALAIEEKEDPGSLAVAQSLINLGAVAYDQGELPEAKDYFLRALTIIDEKAPDSLDQAKALNNLGAVAYDQGHLAAAKAHYLRSLAIKQQLAPDSLIVVSTLVNLGLVVRDQGELTEAKEYSRRALILAEKVAPGSPEVAWALHNLGTISEEQRELAGAKDYYLRALALQEEYAPNTLLVADLLDHLGAVAQGQGARAAARDFHERALAIVETRAPGSPGAAASLHNLGELARMQGDLKGAERYFRRALVITERHAPRSPGLAVSLGSLGAILDETGDARGAAEQFRQALSIFAEKAPNAPDARFPLRRLARLLLERGDPAEARALLKRAEGIDETVRSVPPDAGSAAAAARDGGETTPPAVRFIAPAEDSEVEGDTVKLQLAFVSHYPLARYRLWVNGRPFGEAGFDMPEWDEKGRLLEKGRILEKGDSLGGGRVFEKGRLLEKGEDREAVAKELPEEIAALVKRPPNAHFVELRHSVPVEDTDGQFLRIAVQAETTGGTVSERRILHLRRPEAERRGSLRVLTVGVGDYQFLPKLKYAPADAVALAGVFRAQSGVEDDHRLYRGSTIVSRTDTDASLERIRRDLDQLVAETRPGDTAIVAFSGHGVTKGDQTWFAPVRFDPENPEGTGLAWKEVLAKLEEVRKTARSVWLLADCCRSAPELRRPKDGPRKDQVVAATTRELKQEVEEDGNLIIISASSGYEPSYESAELKHGIFTYAWLEALRGQAPDLVYEEAPRGKVLTFSRLQFWLDTAVIRHSRAAGVRQAIEFPRLDGIFPLSTPVFVPVPP